MAEETAPPSYDDVIGPEGSLPPTAPPLSDITTGDAPPIVDPTPAGEERRSSAPDYTDSPGQSSRAENCVESYITYSIARHLRKYIEPKSEQQDPELDVEAQFGRQAVRSAQMAIEKKRRLQCISGWLWCIGVMLVLLYIALPAAMIVVGVVGIGNCPFRSNTIIVYLIGGGAILAILVAVRTLPSVMTCIRNRNYCQTRDSNACGGCICTMELLFYFVLIINFIALVLGTYTTFAEGNPGSCPVAPTSFQDCCDTFVYVSSATFTVFQFVLYAVTGMFMCLVMCCIRSMDKEMTAL